MEPDMNIQQQWQALLQELEQLEEQRSKEREEMQAWLQQRVLDYPPNHSLKRLMSLGRISEESADILSPRKKRHIMEHQLRELQDIQVWLQAQPPQLQQPQLQQHLKELQSREERLQARLQELAIPSDDSGNDDGGNGNGGAADGDNDGGD